MKSHMISRWQYLHLTLTHSKGQDHRAGNISKTVQIRLTLLLQSDMKSHIGFRLTYSDFTLDHSKGQGQGHKHFDCEYL